MFYENDKKQRITLRLNDEQFSFVREQAETLGVTPSEFLRIVVNTCMITDRKLDKVVAEQLKGVAGRANDKDNLDNIV